MHWLDGWKHTTRPPSWVKNLDLGWCGCPNKTTLQNPSCTCDPKPSYAIVRAPPDLHLRLVVRRMMRTTLLICARIHHRHPRPTSPAPMASLHPPLCPKAESNVVALSISEYFWLNWSRQWPSLLPGWHHRRNWAWSFYKCLHCGFSHRGIFGLKISPSQVGKTRTGPDESCCGNPRSATWPWLLFPRSPNSGSANRRRDSSSDAATKSDVLKLIKNNRTDGVPEKMEGCIGIIFFGYMFRIIETLSSRSTR